MTRSSPLPLQSFVIRTLSIRLAAMAVIVGLTSAAIVHFVEGRNLRSLVVEEIRIEVQSIVQRTVQIIREGRHDRAAAFRQALDDRIALHLSPTSGSFVYICFHDGKTGGIEERKANNYALLDAVLAFIRQHLVTGGETGAMAENITLGGKMHIYVLLPIEYQGQKVGYTQAVFAPSETVLTALQKKLQRTVFLTLLIVLATSILLYPVIFLLVRKLVVFSRNLLEANLDALSLLASAIAKRDSDTDVHNFRVTLYSVRLAERMNMTNMQIQSLIKGAFLHDVGKIGVRDSILLKPGRLNEEEFSLMREHVQHGLDIVGSSHWLSDARQVVGCHHEKYDGNGYPAGIAGDAIPVLARIFAIADVFDALTSQRPYKEPLSCEASLSILEKGRGSHFDPGILDLFVRSAPELFERYAGRDDQGLRDELKADITRYFSSGEILVD